MYIVIEKLIQNTLPDMIKDLVVFKKKGNCENKFKTSNFPPIGQVKL